MWLELWNGWIERPEILRRGKACKNFWHVPPGILQNLDQEPDEVLKTFVLKNGLNFGMDKSRDLKFCSGVKHIKIFDTCNGIFRNLDQGPDGVLKSIFPKYGLNFGMDKLRDLKFCSRVIHLKLFSEIWTRVLRRSWKLFFLNTARNLEWMKLETWNFEVR